MSFVSSDRAKRARPIRALERQVHVPVLHVPRILRYSLILAVLIFVILPLSVWADSVGQISQGKFFAPETKALIESRAGTANPGLHNGDTISYILQFTPIPNGSNFGVGGYVTEYIPANTEVVGASIVQPDGNGGYVEVGPDLPGPAPDGWGTRGQNTYAAPFNVNTYDSTGKCAAASKTNNCNARIAQLYADTGIFYSTDSRTALYALPDGVIRQSTNGYNINPTGANGLNGILGQTQATTHNLWDANNTNAFGSTSAAITALPSPKSAQTALTLTAIGQGSSPFNSGSAVAGSGSGYQLDYTGAVGPWQRIKYQGSRIGSNTDGPATDASGSGAAVVVGSYTNTGYDLSSSNPLPANTNAVRWAVGQLTVGQVRYVKISLRLTAAPPSTGLVNNCEVFGGDVASLASKNAKDNTWRYHIPSVCTSNSNLYLRKEVVKVNGVASDGTFIPQDATLTYRVTYANTSTGTQTNVILTDTLPAQTSGNCVSNVTVISGPLGALPTPRFTPASNPCNAPQTITFNPAAGVTLAPGDGGAIEFDVVTNTAANDDFVINKAKICSTELPLCVNANAVSVLLTQPNLIIGKTVSPTQTYPNGTVEYTITVENTGNAAANTIVLYDILPGLVNTPCATDTRFSFVSGSSAFTGITGVTPTVVCPPTITGFTGLNRQEVKWTFTGQSLAVGATFTVKLKATVGANVTPNIYPNFTRVTYNGGQADATAANVIVSSPTASNLTSFRAQTNNVRRVNIKWETGTELNLVGFNVWRKNNKGEWKKLNQELIPTKNPGSLVGSKYTHKDAKIKAGKKYQYKIELVGIHGTLEWSDVVPVRVPKE